MEMRGEIDVQEAMPDGDALNEADSDLTEAYRNLDKGKKRLRTIKS